MRKITVIGQEAFLFASASSEKHIYKNAILNWQCCYGGVLIAIVLYLNYALCAKTEQCEQVLLKLFLAEWTAQNGAMHTFNQR